MNFLIAAVVLIIIAAFMIIKNARNSAERGEGPDISDPKSAPDNIGDHDGDGDAGE